MKDNDDRFAGWWRETLTLGSLAGGRVPLLVGGAALGLGGCYEEARADDNVEQAQRADEIDRTVDALALQRANGWNVGRSGQPLVFTGSLTTDAEGSDRWRTSMETMAASLAPASDSLQPWYVPTLFQSLIGPGALGLRAVLRPIHTPDMRAAFERGLAVRSLFEQAGWPRNVAVVIDAPGADAVAIGAAMSDQFDPVFVFGNWPHPLGVVPSQQTLAAALFFRPLFDRTKAQRPPGAPPVFVLDSNRLAPYTDENEQFDNRYAVRLPDAQALAARGIQHVLYVSANGTGELDDLNGAFVDLQQHGVDVRMVGLGEFVRDDEAVAASDAEDEEADPAPTYMASLGDLPWFYFWGGFWGGQVRFWDHCGWRWWNTIGGGGVFPPPRGVVVGPPSGHRSVVPLIAHTWSPSPRRTVFGSGALGQVSVRTSRSDGHLTGLRAGRSGTFALARSGSLGRTGAGGSGG
jgi:hypothetical protein